MCQNTTRGESTYTMATRRTPCGGHAEYNDILHHLYDRYHDEKADVLRKIFSVFPNQRGSASSRNSRGLFDFVSKGASFLFGIAFHEELDAVIQQVNNALRGGRCQCRSGGRTNGQTHEPLTLNEQKDQCHERKNSGSCVQRMEGFTHSVRASFETISQYMSLLFRKTIIALEMNDHLKLFLEGLESLSFGHLSPDIISPDQLDSTLRNVTATLQTKFPNFKLTTHSLPY